MKKIEKIVKKLEVVKKRKNHKKTRKHRKNKKLVYKFILYDSIEDSTFFLILPCCLRV